MPTRAVALTSLLLCGRTIEALAEPGSTSSREDDGNITIRKNGESLWDGLVEGASGKKKRPEDRFFV
jgi:hypothetical protein